MPVKTDDPNAVVLEHPQVDREILEVLESNDVHTLGQLIAHDEQTVMSWLTGSFVGLSPKECQKTINKSIEQFEQLREFIDRRCVKLEGKRHSPFELRVKLEKEASS